MPLDLRKFASFCRSLFIRMTLQKATIAILLLLCPLLRPTVAQEKSKGNDPVTLRARFTEASGRDFQPNRDELKTRTISAAAVSLAAVFDQSKPDPSEKLRPVMSVRPFVPDAPYDYGMDCRLSAVVQTLNPKLSVNFAA